jgi:hypothetical protein
MKTVIITLNLAGADTGPFDLYSNEDGFLVPFETGVTKIDLEAGYTSFLVPDSATIIRVLSTSVLCSNYIDLTIGTTTSTTSSTSTTSTSSTTTTTTTLVPSEYDFYFSDQYSCGACSLEVTNVVVAFPTGTSVIIGNYYRTDDFSSNVYRITSTTSPTIALILTDADSSNNCFSVPCTPP